MKIERLKTLREAKRISQIRLAIDLSISQASISKFETGSTEPYASLILQLAKYFSVTTDYLLGNSDKKYAIVRSDLSDDEIKLIFDYRKLDSIQKIKHRAYLDGLSDFNIK